ncbi:DUF3397 domain-containing protein [Sporosarcina sp. FSL K6-1522]|uniref:DUF3397 domain-containing protein n=1 Tax=Sporosarcina sp. FSL K6-1522 TaxID=2921554 RepID=UPI00315AE3C3
MNGVISALIGIVIVCPFVVTLAFLIIRKKLGKSPASGIGLAVDVTTPLLFLAVYIISRTIVGEGVEVYVAGIALIIAIVYAVIERLKVKEFQILRLLRKIWRLYFLILLSAYFVLIGVGLVLKIIDYVT